MVTEFGKFLRVLRITKGMSARELADKFGVSVSYLSAVENGKRAIPPMWQKVLLEQYNLSTEEKDKLYDAIMKSSQSLNVDLNDLSDDKKKLLFAVMRKDMAASTVKELCEVIGKDKVKGDE